ncbi:flagellar protein FliS [Thermanaeromonas toyohensis ToBE]|uniref:Flagellar protein FliS n=1 Tax=Thermanaeromonas toyohensis ToBE TaxID=698762 RepID=A0A1W1VTM4_9FIRM|nr:flagellar export chaperone FliS [Thermanaeromonas toyohensis]SMB96623.1 flagellar protein FliS [Thermanaeromonas toyohensis ToBE]
MEQQVFDYLENKIQTASPGKLLLIAYEGALRLLGQAERALREGNYPAAVRSSVRVQQLMAELTKALDPTVAPDLVENLEKLYDWVSRETADAVSKQQPERLEGPKKVVEELYSAWREAVLKAESCSSAGSSKRPSSVAR